MLPKQRCLAIFTFPYHEEVIVAEHRLISTCPRGMNLMTSPHDVRRGTRQWSGANRGIGPKRAERWSRDGQRMLHPRPMCPCSLTTHTGTTSRESSGFLPLARSARVGREVVPMPYAGRLEDRTSYDTFGRVWTSTTPSAESRFAFTGRDLDPESDLYHYRARYYDPATGQFISADPIGFEAGDGNLYRYVGNGPIDGTDPSGLEDRGFLVDPPPASQRLSEEREPAIEGEVIPRRWKVAYPKLKSERPRHELALDEFGFRRDWTNGHQTSSSAGHRSNQTIRDMGAAA